ncbi:MAG: competence protein ComFB [Bacillota bacterium]|jgi:hypothetical protein|nr:competence protein ComFB [Bacillota bacterium]
MAKTKKTFDKELMYKKIMPSTLKKNADHLNNEEIIDDTSNDLSLSVNGIVNDNVNSIFQNKEIPLSKNIKDDAILYNLTEKLVLEKLDATLKKMNCCKCDRCKEDIVALSLNSLKPMYVVATKDEIKNKIINSDELGIQVTTAVLKAVLAVRKKPRH